VLLHGVLFEMILLHSIFVFSCLHCSNLETQAKYFAWDRLVVVLLLVFVGCFY
jgi:hypothetical protein